VESAFNPKSETICSGNRLYIRANKSDNPRLICKPDITLVSAFLISFEPIY